MIQSTRILSLSLVVTACVVQSINAADKSPIDFNRQIRPILSDNCFQCHGPDGQARQAELRLDSKAGLFRKRDGKTPFVPHKPAQSEAYRRITSKDAGERMPPADSNLKLTPAEIALIKRWIAEGAKWKQHWSFLPVRRPNLPTITPPQSPPYEGGEVLKDWPRNGIDHFILDRLLKAKLTPSKAVSKETLIRRVTLDLTGLPPTIAEVDAFLADKSPKAYERVVDRLLKSPRYGERMALMWLDAARYADTDGYQNDGPRSMWRWRDWVIDAYNSNKRFDAFTIEQLAGDILANDKISRLTPDARLKLRVATGFNRNHRYNSEAGLVLEEFLLENAVDRVDTTGTVWMGLTLGCARCHDHKFDPVSQREYYSLIAYFNNIKESGRAVKFGNSEPWVVAPTKEQRVRLAELDRRIEMARKALDGANVDAALKDPRHFRKSLGSSVVVSRGMTHRFSFDETARKRKAESGKPRYVDGVEGKAVSLDGNSVLTLGRAGDIYAQRRSTVAFWLNPAIVRTGVVLSRQTRNTRRPGLAVEMHKGKLRFYIITRWLAGVAAVESTADIPKDRWTHITLTNDGSQSAVGMKVFINGRESKTRTLHNTNSNTGGTAKNALLRVGGGVHGANFIGKVDDLRFYNRTLWDDEIRLLAVKESIKTLLKMPAEKRGNSQRDKLRAWVHEHTGTPIMQKLATEYFNARMARRKYRDSLPTTMVMAERDKPKPTHVRLRGVYNKLGEKVTRGVPSVMTAMPAGYPANRLGFAKWLVNGKHPLTARVAVNRYWQKYFGTGLVKTAGDFGVQGERPSHPQLLDWLADEFVRTGWDVKGMQKLIVMSATYRQSSTTNAGRLHPRKAARLHPGGSDGARPVGFVVDPQNRLLWRFPRRRLAAHVIRDQALAVSGLLKERLGGPSVSPYQPAKLWAELSNMRYRQSKGDDLYRRSLYTIWKRTIPPPSMTTLDAADREVCWVRTKRTNTPLQALALLNEKIYVEAARKLGERMLREGGKTPIVFAFRTVTSRRPKPGELKLLRQAHQQYFARFRREPAAAKKLLQTGSSKVDASLDAPRLAAATVIANVLLNLDEVITQE